MSAHSPNPQTRIPASESLPNFTHQIIDDGRITICEELGAGAFGKVYRGVVQLSTPPSPEQPVQIPRAVSYSSFAIASKLWKHSKSKSSTKTAAYSNLSVVRKNTRPRSASFAIKCLAKPPPNSREARLQQRELMLHRRVSAHAHIVSMHRVLSDEDHRYVVLDFHSGGDLFTAITEKNRYEAGNDRLIKRDFLQILDAVHYCHENRVFHRDIKPENILISEDGRNLYLADFGLSTTVETSSTVGCGSSYYMSPETIGREFRRKTYLTPPTDVWALGVILVNMITGRCPWRVASLKDECFAAYIHDPDFLTQALPISEQISDVVKMVFKIEPAERLTLSEFGECVLLVDTFYYDAPLVDEHVEAFEQSAVQQTKTLDSDEVYLYGSVPDDEPAHATVRIVEQVAAANASPIIVHHSPFLNQSPVMVPASPRRAHTPGIRVDIPVSSDTDTDTSNSATTEETVSVPSCYVASGSDTDASSVSSSMCGMPATLAVVNCADIPEDIKLTDEPVGGLGFIVDMRAMDGFVTAPSPVIDIVDPRSPAGFSRELEAQFARMDVLGDVELEWACVQRQGQDEVDGDETPKLGPVHDHVRSPVYTPQRNCSPVATPPRKSSLRFVTPELIDTPPRALSHLKFKSSSLKKQSSSKPRKPNGFSPRIGPSSTKQERQRVASWVDGQPSPMLTIKSPVMPAKKFNILRSPLKFNSVGLRAKKLDHDGSLRMVTIGKCATKTSMIPTKAAGSLGRFNGLGLKGLFGSD